MTITELVAMAERIHDAEGVNLGASSSREQRNAFWARAVGCAHHGHPVYNLKADPRWHIKDAGGGRPQSDDVAVSMPSREAWDCIPGAGSDGYRFEADAIGILPMGQNVYPPAKPAGSGAVVPPVQPPQATQPPGREEALDEQKFLHAYYMAPEGLQRPKGLWRDDTTPPGPDFEGIATWYLDIYQRERMAMKSRADSRAAYVKQIRQSDEWKAKHPGETP
ncbi:MAG: hypothetical protein ACKVQA_07045 [Burkholderiales bacterium]